MRLIPYSQNLTTGAGPADFRQVMAIVSDLAATSPNRTPRARDMAPAYGVARRANQ